MVSHGREELELLGRELADFRVKAGFTQGAVGTFLGVARLTVSQWERGLRAVPWAELCRMADLYNVQPSEVVRRALDSWIPPTLKLYDVKGVANFESQTVRAR